MGGGPVGEVGSYFKFKTKDRHDSFTDQFNRIFIVKALLAATILLGKSWYSSEINCIIPGTAGISGDFVSESCWINGMYVFKELKTMENFKGYYGVPNPIDHNGLSKKANKDGITPTCSTSDNPGTCVKMEKVFYNQYQYLPFYTALLGLLYYLPYLMYVRVNSDMISLEKTLKTKKFTKEDLLYDYFDDKVTNPARQNLLAVMNILVKIMYLVSNVLAFIFTDNLLNGDFKSYGAEWFDWIGMENFKMYNYIDIRTNFRAGEVLLPSFLLCDVLEVSNDIKHDLLNEHTFVCEVKSHVLYQYVLALIWLLFVIGMCMSIIGIFECIARYFLSTKITNIDMVDGINMADERHILSHLNRRQKEYLAFINKNDISAYKDLVKELQEKFARQRDNITEPLLS